MSTPRTPSAARPTAIAAVVALSLLTAACSNPPAADEERTLTVAIEYAGSFDMTLVGQLLPVQTDTVYDPLWYASPTGEITYQLAESYAFDDEHTVLSDTLRDGITFSDGSPLSAEAVVTVLEAYRTAPIMSTYFATVGEMEATGDLTFDLHLDSYDPSLVSNLGVAPIMHPALIGDPDAEMNPVGTGAYTVDLSRSTVGIEYVFIKRDDAWEAADRPFDTIVAKVIADPTARVNALKSGQVDVAAIPDNAIGDVEAAGFAADAFTMRWAGLAIGDLHGEFQPALADVRVRQALSYAFDREAITQVLYPNFGVATNQIGGPTTGFYREDREDDYRFDPERARELLAEAGYPDGFEVTISGSTGVNDEQNPLVVQALADIGVTATYVIHQPATWLTDSRGQSIWTAGNSFATLVDRDLNKNGLFNLWQRSDPRLDELVAQYHDGSIGDDERREVEGEIGDFLLDEVWFIPFLRSSEPYAWNSDVVDIPAEAFDDSNRPFLHPGYIVPAD